MKRKNVSLYWLVLLLMATFSNVEAQQVFKISPASDIGYLEYLPQGYDGNSDKYPLVIFLHGLGERGPNTVDPAQLAAGIASVSKHGPPKHAKAGTQFPFIMLSPQLKNNFGDWPTWYVMEIINYAKTYLRVDEKRIYLTGLSLGGGGTWWVSQDNPKTFAAIAPVCGSRNTTSKACLLAAENLPVWAFHGDKDSTVPLSRTVNMVNSVNACTPAPTPLAKITIYPGVNHNSWDNAYKPDNTIHTPNVYDWLLSHTNEINAGNRIPQANAGTDISITAATATLKATGTDSDGTIASYAWTQLSGPSTATLANAATATLTVSKLVAGKYTFRVKVTDNIGDADADYVTVTVAPSTNKAPVANAGEDKTILLPVNTVVLTGTATDSDGTIASYAWTKVSGGAATLANANTATVTVSDLVSGTYTFRLTVTDNGGATHTDDVNVLVNSSTNIAPVADAGTNKTVTLPVSYKILAGTGTDSDGTIVAYEWTKVSGPACTLSDFTTARLKVSDITSGNYVFQLKVTDNQGATAVDQLSVVFNYTPVANAGPDISLELPTTTAVLKGSGTDTQGTIASYAWTKVSGPNVVMANAKTADLSLSGLQEGIYSFQLTIKDNQGTKAVAVTTVTVNPVGYSQSAARMAATTLSVEADTEDETAVAAEVAVEETPAHKFSLEEWTSIEQAGYSVVIFNESGGRIFAGQWTEDSYQAVFSQKGLYFYNIMQNGRRIDSGKVFIRM